MRLRTKRLAPTARFQRAILLAALLVAAMPVRAAEGVKVEVVVDGLSAEMKRNVLGSMILVSASAGGRLTEGEARRLAARAPREIEQALQPFGYYRPVIHDHLDATGDTWKARFEVEPGPPLPIASVSVEVAGPGADLPKFKQLVRDFPLKQGSRLEHAPYEALKAALTETASQNGYLDAKFARRRIEVDLEAYTARIEMRFETGPRYFFGPVRFHQDVLDSSLTNGFVKFKTGEPFSVDSLLAMQRALGASPYFSRVEVEPQRDEAKDLQVPIDVRLEPAKALRYTVGGGYGTDTGLQAEASLEFRRLNKKGHRARIHVLASELRSEAGLQYQTPRTFGVKQLMTYSLAVQDEETDAQRSRGGVIGASLTREGTWQESFGLYLQREDFTVGVDTGRPDLFFPQLSWLRVRRDDRLDPRAGSRLRFLGRAATEQIWSDVTFTQVSVETKFLWSPGKHDRVIARAEAGATQTDKFHALPPDVRYFAGGAQSVRAYGYQELGPHDANGEPTGGERLLFGSFEYERRLFGPWGLAGFYDIGNAIAHFGDPLQSGTGVGIRWFSPVGMVRLDYAWPINDPEHGRQIQFSIGPDL